MERIHQARKNWVCDYCQGLIGIGEFYGWLDGRRFHCDCKRKTQEEHRESLFDKRAIVCVLWK